MVCKITPPKHFQRKGQPKNPEEAIYGVMCWYMFTNCQTLQEGKNIHIYIYTHTHIYIYMYMCVYVYMCVFKNPDL